MFTSLSRQPADRAKKPFILRILPDIAAFTIGLGVAYWQKWETTDLIWSLWLSSLVTGYLTLLMILAGGAYLGYCGLSHEEFNPKHRRPAILIGLVGGLFFLGFFSFHFCGFHAGHSVFLQAFFPIDGMPRSAFGDAFTNPVLLWILVFKHLMEPYGYFLIPAIITERKYLFLPLTEAIAMVRDGTAPVAERQKNESANKFGDPNAVGKAIAQPYINVIRMHILIFFFAGCHFLKINSFIVFAVVYLVYFFPRRTRYRTKEMIPANLYDGSTYFSIT